MMRKASAKFTAVILVASLSIGGCATTGGQAGGKTSSNFECDPAVAATVGAVLGALAGGGNNTLRGAALGGALGALACVAINYNSEQVKTAQQVQDEYKASHNGQAPEQTTVVKYDTRFKQAAIRAGDKTELNSYVEIAQGRNDASLKIEEEMSLYKPDGSLVKTVRKSVNPTAAAGAFKSQFQIPMPEGVPDGVYPVKTNLYVNDAKVRSNSAKFQVAMEGGHMIGKLLAAN